MLYMAYFGFLNISPLGLFAGPLLASLQDVKFISKVETILKDINYQCKSILGTWNGIQGISFPGLQVSVEVVVQLGFRESSTSQYLNTHPLVHDK